MAELSLGSLDPYSMGTSTPGGRQWQAGCLAMWHPWSCVYTSSV